MRFLAITGLVGLLAWSSGTLLRGGDQAANEPAVLSVRGARSAKAERVQPVIEGPSTTLAVGLPAILPGGVVLVSDDRLTPQQLEAPLEWPSDIAEESDGAPGRFQPAPSLSVVEPPGHADSGRSILKVAPQESTTSDSNHNQLRVAQRATRPAPSRVAEETAPPLQRWRSPMGEDQPESPAVDETGAELAQAPQTGFAAGEPLGADGPVETEADADEPVHGGFPSESGASSVGEAVGGINDDDSDFAFLREEATPAVGESVASAMNRRGATIADKAQGAMLHEEPASVFSPAVETASPAASGNDVSCRWVVPEQLNLGEQATCRMVVGNAGNSTAHAVLVRIELPKNVRLANADPAPNAAGQALTWKIPRLEPGQNHEVLLSVVPTAEGNVTPTATVTCTRLAQASIAVRKPNLEVKVEGGERLSLGQPATYQLVVRNSGSGAAGNVQLAARFSEGLHHPQGQEVRYRVGTLAAGETRHVQLPLTGLRPGACVIEVLVAAGDKLLAESKRNVEVVKPTLQVALSGPKLRYVDRKATYMLRVHNPGPAPADNVQLLEQLPQGMRFLEASPGGSFDPHLKQVAWFVGRLEPQQTAEVGVHVVAEEAGDHTLAAVAKADSGVTAKAKTVTKVEGVSLVVLDVVDRDDPIEAGSETAYEIRVTNRGSEPAHQVQVAARLPESMLALKASGPTEAAVEGRQVVFEPLANLAPGQSQVFVVNVKCLQAGVARFQAFFRSQEEPKALMQEQTTRIYGE